jgi:hypothetical protein
MTPSRLHGLQTVTRAFPSFFASMTRHGASTLTAPFGLLVSPNNSALYGILFH